MVSFYRRDHWLTHFGVNHTLHAKLYQNRFSIFDVRTSLWCLCIRVYVYIWPRHCINVYSIFSMVKPISRYCLHSSFYYAPWCHAVIFLFTHFIICEIMEKLYFGTVHLLGQKKKEMQYSQCFSPKIYDHSVALNQSVIFGGGVTGPFFVLPLSCWFAIWLFYIKLSYVAIKEDFCKKKKKKSPLCLVFYLYYSSLLSVVIYSCRRSEGFTLHVKRMLTELTEPTLDILINSSAENRGYTHTLLHAAKSIFTLSYL